MADEKIIFSMCGVGKVLPHNNKVILKDIYLSFFYGAKIGIIGLNGSGKSTLMKIIAGVEKSYKGEVVWAPGYSVGYNVYCSASFLYLKKTLLKSTSPFFTS